MLQSKMSVNQLSDCNFSTSRYEFYFCNQCYSKYWTFVFFLFFQFVLIKLIIHS